MRHDIAVKMETLDFYVVKIDKFQKAVLIFFLKSKLHNIVHSNKNFVKF